MKSAPQKGNLLGGSAWGWASFGARACGQPRDALRGAQYFAHDWSHKWQPRSLPAHGPVVRHGAPPVRRFLLDLLAARETEAGELAEMVQMHFGIGWPATTRHLKIMQRAGFARVRREWSNRVYRLDDEAIDQLQEAVTVLRQRWSTRAGAGYHSTYDPEDDPWQSEKQARRPRDAEEDIARIMIEHGFDPDTGKPLARGISQNGAGLTQ